MSNKLSRRSLRVALAALIVFLTAGGEPVLSGPNTPAPMPLGFGLRSNNTAPVVEPGQALTRLSDGQWLLTGGLSHPEQIAMTSARGAPLETVSQSLGQPRSNHSASLLPDGSVLIYGGHSPDGALLNTAEVINPETASVTWLGPIGLSPRAGQITTVLSDGRLLMVGGVGEANGPSPNPEVYDPNSRQVEQLPGFGNLASLHANTAMLASGDVMVWSDNGSGSQSAWLFSHDEGQFSSLTMDQAAQLLNPTEAGGPHIAFSQPESGTITAIDQPLAVRFSQPIASLNASAVTLIGPNGVTPTRVTQLDEGSLLFVTPEHDLTPGADYTLFLSGAATTTGQALPFTTVGFRAASLAPNSSSTTIPAAADSQASTRAVPPGSSPTSATAKSASSVLKDARDVRSGITSNALGSEERPSLSKPSSSATSSNQTADSAAGQEGDRWIPTEANRHGRWVSGHGRAHAQQTLPQNETLRRALHGHPEIVALTKGLRPSAVASGMLRKVVPAAVLRAAADVTMVSGQVLRLNGQPLKGVTLTMANRTAKTDANGEFRLLAVPAGHQVLVINGNTANHDALQYGRYEYGTTVVAGKDNALPFVIWLTALDLGDAVTIPAPTTGTTRITNPEIPGLELQIPAGTVIRDAAGKIVTRISMTAIPTDRAPFPLPNVPVPVYFTIQPGGAHLEAAASQVNSGARLVYPNFTHQRPNTRMRFWNYDTTKGWYVYGYGRVSADGTQVVPDPGVVIYEFSGAMISDPDNSDDDSPNKCSEGGDPVDCSTGLFLNTEVDLRVADVMPIEVRRSYRQKDPVSRAFGIGTNLGYDFFLVGTSNSMDATGEIYSYQDLILPDGQRIHYPRVSPGTDFSDAVYQASTSPGPFMGSILVWDLSDPTTPWLLTLRDGTQFRFADSDGSTNARDAAVRQISDRHGNRISLFRDINANLTQITSPNGRHISLSYDGYGRVTQATDDLGRTVSYNYDSSGRLSQVTDPASHSEYYSYDSNDNLLVVTDKRGHAKVTNTYDSNSRVISQTYADSTSSSFSYTLNTAGDRVTQTDYTDPRGTITRTQFDAAGFPTQIIRAYGLSIQQTTSFSRDTNTNLLSSVTDALGRVTSYTYDSLGNQTSVTKLSGTAGAVTDSTQINATFSLPTVMTDANGHSTNLSYNQVGDLTSVADPLGHTWAMTYDAEGRLLTSTDPNSHTVTYSYAGGDLAWVTDALGNRRTLSADAAGRPTAQASALGSTALLAYNAIDLPTTTTDPNGSQVGMAYDANSSLVSVTDAMSHTVSYARDVMNRMTSWTDPLSNVESYQYEPGGSVNQVVDRKGQLRGMTYDALGRLTGTGFGATVAHPTSFLSTIANTWDGGDRLTQITDSNAGTITRTYDGLDRLTQEVTPQGTVNYTYDAGGRRASMSVQGQPTVTYTWDNANRLTQLTQAAGTINGGTAMSITFSYDNANRRTLLTLPNGATASYTYDNADHLIGIDFARSNTTSIGNLTYSYDADGRRTSIGGSLANITVPTVGTTSTYDADNRLTLFNTVSRSYDANGSLTSDGTNSYSWNERNQLVGVSGSTSASFAYDGVGRRIQRTLGSVTQQYLYDGWDYVQEQDGSGTLTAALLKGNIDELFARMTPTAISSSLTDVLGSVVAETDLTQNITTTYSYDPYGSTSVTGTSTGNALRYVGRENDLAGLYYYRARYFDPKTARFLSQDPLGLAPGPNRYAYVRGNPVGLRDPFGLEDQSIVDPNDETGSGKQGQNACRAANDWDEWYREALDRLLKGDIDGYKRLMDKANDAMRRYYENLNQPLNPTDYPHTGTEPPPPPTEPTLTPVGPPTTTPPAIPPVF